MATEGVPRGTQKVDTDGCSIRAHFWGCRGQVPQRQQGTSITSPCLLWQVVTQLAEPGQDHWDSSQCWGTALDLHTPTHNTWG